MLITIPIRTMLCFDSLLLHSTSSSFSFHCLLYGAIRKNVRRVDMASAHKPTRTKTQEQALQLLQQELAKVFQSVLQQTQIAGSVVSLMIKRSCRIVNPSNAFAHVSFITRTAEALETIAKEILANPPMGETIFDYAAKRLRSMGRMHKDSKMSLRAPPLTSATTSSSSSSSSSSTSSSSSSSMSAASASTLPSV